MDYQIAPGSLKGKVILVTGAGDGIGRQAALSYASQGAHVILLGRTVEKLENVYDEIEAIDGEQAAIVPLDMLGATPKHYRDLAHSIKELFGRLDGLLHNAGMLGTLGPFEQIEPKTFNQVMQVNLNAAFFMTQALLPLIKKSENGRIIFTSSSVGQQGRAYWGGYCISKFATEGMMQALADELTHTKVRVNAINPGATRTAMRAAAFPAEEALSLKTPLDIMPLYLYLMSSESQQIHGQTLNAQPKYKLQPQK